MSDLTEVPLSTFADITMGQSPDAESINSEGQGLPFLQGCAEFGRKSPRAEVFCSPALRVGKADSVLVSVRAPVGTMNYADQDYCIGRGLAAIRAKQSLGNVGYLKHAIELNSGFLHRRSQGSTFSAISSADLRQVPIPDFPFDKQTKIAAILTSLDTAIEKTEALIEKHQQIKAGLMHDLFTRGVLPDGQLRPPREQAPEQFQETSLGQIPRKWNISALGSLVSSDITYGIVQAGPHVDGGIPYVRTGDMSGDFLDRSQMLCTSRRIANAYKRSEVRSGDIVMAIRATVGKVLPVPQELDGANLTQGTAKVSAKDGIDRTFLLWALRQRRFQESVLAAIKGTTFAEITLAALRKLPLAVPSCTNEQALIALRLQRCEGMIQIEQQQRDKLQQQKIGLMQDLLTGKVPVKVADPEAVPA